MKPTTITLSSWPTGIAVGAVLQVGVDRRSWWRKLLGWALRQPSPVRRLRITKITGVTLTVEDV